MPKKLSNVWSFCRDVFFGAKVLMESGDVYGVGENWYGQLGIGSKDRETEVFCGRKFWWILGVLFL